MTYDEAHLIRLAQQGDANACTTLYERHYDTVYRYCYSRVSDVGLAQDLTAEVFVRMVDKLHTFKARGRPLMAWLYTIARNLVADTHRQNSRAIHLPLDSASGLGSRGEGDPVRRFERQNEAECLATALRHLTEEQRQVILLKFMEDYRNGQIARILGKSEGAVNRSSTGRWMPFAEPWRKNVVMRHDVEAAVDQCLAWLREGKDMESCLSHYPEYAAELRPLLEVAAGVVRIRFPASQAGARAAGQQRMLAALAQKQEGLARVNPIARSARQTFWSLLSGRAGGLMPGGLRPAWQLAGVMLIIVLFASGWMTVAASADSLPGDALYPVKLASQGARLALMLDSTRQRLMADQFEGQRRQDIRAALSGGRQVSVEFQGVLQQIEGDLWVVGGLPVSLQATTAIAGQPALGAVVRVRADLPGNGGLVASWLEIESTTTPEPTDTRQPTTTPSPTQTPEEVDSQEPTPTLESTTTPGATETPTPDGTSEDEGTPEPAETSEPDDDAEDEGTPEPAETSEPDEASEDEGTPETVETPEPDGTSEDEGAPEPAEPDEESEDEGAPQPAETSEPDDDAEDERAPRPAETSEPDDDAEDEGAPQPAETSEPDDDAEDEGTPEPAETSEPDDDAEDEGTPEPAETPEPDEASEDEGTPEPAGGPEPDGTSEDGQTPEPDEPPEEPED